MLGKIRQKLVTQQQPEEFKQVELLCPICDRPIPDSQKDAHHFIPKSKGGKATEYLHRICHRQIHALFTETQLARELNTAEACLAPMPKLQV
jgi:5-methylcytosine-specific restriction endonuclease McrA